MCLSGLFICGKEINMILPNNLNVEKEILITLPEWLTYEKLYFAAKKCFRNVRWKSSVTKYEINLLINIQKLLDAFMSDTYTISKYSEFVVYEPKLRKITATRLADRIPQRCFCDNYFYDVITKSFIYDNCACQVGKGTLFATNRLKHFYRDYWNKNRTNDGWILKCDIHHFFQSINHNILKDKLSKIITDKFSLNFVYSVIDSFGEVGLGLGSQVSQLLALFYLSELDHIIKEYFQIHYYIRYMDDFILIHKDKQKLKVVWNFLKEYLPSIGLTLNNKTLLQKLNMPTIFMKWQYRLTMNGKVLLEQTDKELTKKRRKIKVMVNKYKSGKMKKKQLYQSINGMFAHMYQGNCYTAVNNLKKYFNDLMYFYKNIHKKYRI